MKGGEVAGYVLKVRGCLKPGLRTMCMGAVLSAVWGSGAFMNTIDCEKKKRLVVLTSIEKRVNSSEAY